MANVAPLQRLILQLVEAADGSSVERMAAAIGMIEEMHRRGAAFFVNRPDVSEFLDEFRSRSANYLVHEYLHKTWNAFYVADIVRELEGFGLAFAAGFGAEDLLHGAHEASLGHPAHLQLHDFMVDRRYRRDLYVHRDRPQDAPGPRCDVARRIAPLISEAHYQALRTSLRTDRLPVSLDELVRSLEAARATQSEAAVRRAWAVIAFLLGRGVIGLEEADASPARHASAKRYNAASLSAEPGSINQVRPLVVPGVSGGVRIDPIHHRALRGRGAAAVKCGNENPGPMSAQRITDDSMSADPLAHLSHLPPIPY